MHFKNNVTKSTSIFTFRAYFSYSQIQRHNTHLHSVYFSFFISFRLLLFFFSFLFELNLIYRRNSEKQKRTKCVCRTLHIFVLFLWFLNFCLVLKNFATLVDSGRVVSFLDFPHLFQFEYDCPAKNVIANYIKQRSFLRTFIYSFIALHCKETTTTTASATTKSVNF